MPASGGTLPFFFMEMLPAAFASGWASGINAWATVFVLGILGRFSGIEGVPEGFQRTDVLIVMGVLCVIEVAADKIPYVDSIWDGVSTFIRPIAGVVIGALWAGESGSLAAIALGAVGGITALISHLTKAALRLAVNTTPEPFTNVAASATGDVAVTGVATLVALAPVAAAVVVLILMVLGLLAVWFVMARVRRGWREVRRRRGMDRPAAR